MYKCDLDGSEIVAHLYPTEDSQLPLSLAAAIRRSTSAWVRYSRGSQLAVGSLVAGENHESVATGEVKQ